MGWGTRGVFQKGGFVLRGTHRGRDLGCLLRWGEEGCFQKAAEAVGFEGESLACEQCGAESFWRCFE